MIKRKQLTEIKLEAPKQETPTKKNEHVQTIAEDALIDSIQKQFGNLIDKIWTTKWGCCIKQGKKMLVFKKFNSQGKSKAYLTDCDITKIFKTKSEFERMTEEMKKEWHISSKFVFVNTCIYNDELFPVLESFLKK